MKRPFDACLVAAGIALTCRLIAACGFVEFDEDPGVSLFPSEANGVLPAQARIRASFDFSPERTSVESVFTVKDFAGAIAGEFSWEGNTVSFSPEPGLKPGGRYVLSFDGKFKSADGKEYEVRRLIPFFSEFQNDEAPFIRSIDPVSGSFAPGTKRIRIVFSRAMNAASFLKGFSLSPRTEYDLGWEGDGTAAVLSPKSSWKNLTTYTLSFSEEITDVRGAGLSPCRDPVFIVQDDIGRPAVLSVEAALNDPHSSFPSLGNDLAAMLFGKDALRIVFSEPMAPETKDAVFLSPGVPGTWYWLENGRVLVLSPVDFYEAGRSYTLEIGHAAEDVSGNRLLPFEPLVFSPATGCLSFACGFAADGLEVRDGDFSAAVPLVISVDAPVSTDYTFTFLFEGGSFDSDEEKLSALDAITLTCVFPRSAPSPVIVGSTWTGGNRLVTTWTGIRPSDAVREYCYLLSAAGGPGGMRTAKGNILRNTERQLLKAEAR